MAGRAAGGVKAALLLAAIAVGLVWPVVWAALSTAASAPADDPVSITAYTADYQVAADGSLAAEEQVVAEFPYGRHGIFRYWDLADAADRTVRYVPTVQSVTRDGRPEPYTLSWAGGYRYLVARIGDAGAVLEPGRHTYRITYSIPGSVSPASTSSAAAFVTSTGTDDEAGSAFLWAVVASGWEMPIARAEVTVRLPSPSGAVQCATDPWHTPGPCAVRTAGPATVLASAEDLDPRTGMILRATLQPPPPVRTHLPWSVTWDPVLGRTEPVTWILLLLSVAGAVAGVLVARSTREEPPGFPVQYAPPTGLGPVQAVYVDSEEAGPAPLVASVLYLAERGLVRLERPTPTTWRVTGLAGSDQWAAVDPVTRSIAAQLGLFPAGSFDASGSAEAGKVLRSAQDGIVPAVEQWSLQAGLMQTSPRERREKVLWFLAVGLAVVLFALPAVLALAGSLALVPTLAGLPVAMFVLFGLGLSSAQVGHRRTDRGRLEWARSGGFRRLLSTPSAEERFDFAARTDVFLAYVPYAVAFGVADRWAEKYRTQMGTEPPIPAWYPVTPGYSAHEFYSGGGLGGFSAAVSTSIAAYAAAQAASHSGGGGGGGGFGGGGGGGGGSW